MKFNNDKHIRYIKQLYDKNNEKVDITCPSPSFAGKKHPIYIAKTDKSKTVFRFSHKRCARYNANVSDVLTHRGFNVPKVMFLKLGSEYCETYPFIEGTTLAERIVTRAPFVRKPKNCF